VHPLIPGLPSDIGAIIHRHAPIASLVNDFYVMLHGESRNAHYPRDPIEAVLAAMPTLQAPVGKSN
jgi:hypothetical protein